MMKRKAPAFYTPCFSDAIMRSERNLVNATKGWLAYFRRLVTKPLKKRDAEELRAARDFIREAMALKTSSRSEFASATTVERKTIADEATDTLEKVDSALAKFDFDEILHLI